MFDFSEYDYLRRGMVGIFKGLGVQCISSVQVSAESLGIVDKKTKRLPFADSPPSPLQNNP